ncbi:CAAX prenyl protease 1 [Podochytrium sp. JEL0797]|nr:CAAX prenyl protease 1 [Podochytrium sp. JEL0797]
MDESDSDSENEQFVSGKKALLKRMKTKNSKKEPVAEKTIVKNKQRVMVLSSRGIIHRYRHLMNDIHLMLPHSKKDSKLDSKTNLGLINELASDNQCNNCLFFEVRKHKDLFLWMSRTPNGPSVKFLVENVHTMDELRMTGNHLKGSRPILSFDSSFDNPETPHLQLLKEMFSQTFGTPRTSRKIKPFVDHVLMFSVVNDVVFFRNYQIIEKTIDRQDEPETSLVEVGPRFTMSVVRIFSGSFMGTTLYENPEYVSPNTMRSEEKKEAKLKYIRRLEQKQGKAAHPEQEDEFKDLGVPSFLTDKISAEEHEKAKEYGRDKSAFEFAASVYQQVIATGILVCGVMPAIWGLSRGVLEGVGLGGEREILRSIVFVIISLLSSSLIDVPFSLYKNFVIEERYGFNKSTLSLFFVDKTKELFLTTAISAPLVAGLLRVIQWGGDKFFYYVWIFMLSFQVTLILIFPTVIAPWFNKFTPLEDGELKTQIGELAKRVKFPLTKIFVIDGSTRSSHSNAYFTGLFKDKRIVLYDTLLQHQTNPEILAVLAHELGHWQKSHILAKLAISQLQLFLVFYTFSHFIHSSPMYTAFGFPNEHPVMIGLVLFSYIYQPIDSLSSFLSNYVSRVHEFEADTYAKRLGYAEQLKSGLIKLHSKNLGNLIPDPWYSAWHYSHPPLVERLAAIGKTE